MSETMNVLSRIIFTAVIGFTAPLINVDGALAQSAAQLTYQKGVDAFDVGDYRKAYKYWIDLAHDGNPQAMRSVAHILNRGLGIQRDPKQAYQWYRKSAESGLATAQANTAFMLLEGKGVEKDEVEAASWFKKAAEQNNSIAQYNLGIMYELGIGVPIDAHRSLNWYTRAAEQGHKRAEKRVAVLKPKVARAEESEEAVKTNVESTSQNTTIAKIEPITEAEKVEPKKEIKEEPAVPKVTVFKAPKKSKKGLQAGALVFPSSEAEASTPTETEQKAVSLLPKATEKSEVSDPLKPITDEEPTVKEPEKTVIASIEPKKKPVIKKNDGPLVEAQKAYSNGEYRRAAAIWQELADSNNPDAQFWLGRLYNRGEGLTLDRSKAYKMWRLASKNGHSSASTALVNLISRMSPDQIEQAEAELR